MSLREILITTGNNPLPRPPHTPPQRPVTPERRREPAREFLVSAGPSATPDIPRPPPRRYGTDSGFQPNRTVATEDTPVHQLYYPLSLSLALKKDEHIWNDKQGNRSENTVFVLIHQVDDDNEEVFVYLSPTEANVHALELMVKKHPTAFALPRIEEAEVKKEEYERASSVARKIGLRTAVQSQQIIRVSDAESGNASQHVVEEHVWIKSEDPEDQFRARAPDVRPDTNNRGEILLGMGPEIKYIYWGDWKIVSHGLKMEARQLDETRTKITVSLKNLRKPRK
ncbi:Uu.00g055390.m01.CDS01 [Anthostomella pinea]|uniref:Uu.00g055390.m01.CDS01 n=1 Tax=Anthostomella pinea TaxID=933095 RepID=A0AAI8VXH7_9PEZI|nr:Uu.00g055390.m01.CDS01 [Anthostomella pinea]